VAALRSSRRRAVGPVTYYRRAAQSHLYDVWQNADILLQSVEEARPVNTSLGGFTLRWVRLGGVLKEGFKFSVSP